MRKESKMTTIQESSGWASAHLTQRNPPSLRKTLGGFFFAHPARTPISSVCRGSAGSGVSLSGDERTTEPTAASRSNCCLVRFSRSGEVQVRASQGSSGSMSGVASTGVRVENPASKRVGRHQSKYPSTNTGEKAMVLERELILR